jgi:hypothetical protein
MCEEALPNWDWDNEQLHTFTVIAKIQAQASIWVKEGKNDTQR